MALSVKELQIGDWVERFGKKFQIKAHQFTECNFEPIPLTAEILEKNGWIYVLTENEYRSPEDKSFGEAFRLQAGEDENHFWWIEGITLIHPINYVHTLQHALRLCGLNELADSIII